MSRSSQIDLTQTISHLQQQVEQLWEQSPDLNAAQRGTWERSLQDLTAGIRGLQRLHQDLGEDQGHGSGLDDWGGHRGFPADLKLVQERYRAILEVQEDIVCRYTPRGVLTYANPALYVFHGRPLGSLLGTNWIEQLPLETQVQVQQEINQLTPAQPIHRVERQTRDAEGRPRWFEWIDHGIFDESGKLVEIQSVGRDRTQQKQIEAEFQHHQVFLEQSQRVGRMGSFTLDLSNNELIWSLETYRLLGQDPETYQPSFQKFLQQVHPQDREQLRQHLDHSLQEEDLFQLEFRVVRPDGSILFVEDRAEIIRDGQGKAIRLIGTVFDITERKQTEDRLRKSEGRLRTLIESFPFIVWAKDREGKITLQNSTSSQMWGHWVGQHHQPQLSDDILTIWQEEEQRAGLGEIVTAEDVLIFGDHQRHFFKIIAPIYNGDQIEGILGVSFDITDRKRVEQALHLNQIRLQTLVDTIPMGIWARDAAGNLILQNLTDRLNYGDLINTGRETLPILEKQKQMRSEFSERAQRGETLFYETEEIIGHETRHFLRMTTAFPDQEGKVGTMGTAIDITDRVQMEEDLRRSEELFRAVFEKAAVGISQADTEGHFLKVNPKLCEIMGYTEDELKQFRYFDLTHPDDVYLGWDDFQQLMQGEISSYSVEKRFLRKDGEIRWLNVTVSLVRDRRDCPLYEIAVIEDVTDRKLLIQQKDEFISTVSHELRTPLTSIHALLGLLSTGRLGTLTELGQRLLKAAKTDTDRLNRLLDDLLNLQRLKAQNLGFRQECFSVNILVAQVLCAMNPLASEAQIVLQSEIQTPIAWGDPDQIIQVLTNLVGNSIKFSPAGSEVRISVHACSDHTLWQVQDQGIGIPKDRLQIIFEPFQLADSSDNRHHSSSGLGLAICDQIVRHHHGQIWAENLEVGSRFSFTLPHPQDLFSPDQG